MITTPANANQRIYQGDDYNGVVTIYNADGSPADLTGCTGKAQLRRTAEDPDPPAAEFTVTPMQGGAMLLHLASATTATLDGQYVWDFQLTDPSGMVSTMLAGYSTVTEQVTR